MAKKAVKKALKTVKKKVTKKPVKKADPYREIIDIIEKYDKGSPPRTRESLED